MSKDKHNPLMPSRRFPEFRDSGPWSKERLGDFATIIKGRGISKADVVADGKTPCVRYAELYTQYGDVIDEVVSRTNIDPSSLVLSKAGDVLIPASGETKADIATAACVTTDGVALGSDLNVVRSKLYGPFFSYYLNGSKRFSIAKVAQGDTVAHLYPRQLEQVDIVYPDAAEQHKIAECLSSLDDWVAAETDALAALRRHKTGLMQQLFPRLGETRPRLRFPEFQDAGEWEAAKVGDVFKVTRGEVLAMPLVSAQKSESMPYPVYSSQTKHFGLAGFYSRYLYEDAITWTTDGANAGEVSYRDGKFFCTNVCGVLISTEGHANSCVAELLNTVTRLHVSYVGNPKLMNGVMAKIEVPIPETAEQHRIADCLDSLDARISAQSDKLAALREHKRGLMQQLFPAPDAAEGGG